MDIHWYFYLQQLKNDSQMSNAMLIRSNLPQRLCILGLITLLVKLLWGTFEEVMIGIFTDISNFLTNFCQPVTVINATKLLFLEQSEQGLHCLLRQLCPNSLRFYNNPAMILEIMFSGHDLHVPSSLLALTPTVIKQFIIVHSFLGSRAEERSETKKKKKQFCSIFFFPNWTILSLVTLNNVSNWSSFSKVNCSCKIGWTNAHMFLYFMSSMVPQQLAVSFNTICCAIMVFLWSFKGRLFEYINIKIGTYKNSMKNEYVVCFF